MDSKYNLLFIIGSEGTGHHLFENMKYDTYENYEDVRSLALKYFKSNDEHKKELKEEIYSITKKRIGKFCVESASYPFFRPLNVLNSIDIYSFYELFNSIEHVNLNLIILNRNIVNSTLSSYNRFDKSNKLSIHDSVRIQEIMKIYISSQIQLIPSEKYIIVDLLDLQKNIKSFISLVGQKFNLNLDFKIDMLKISNENKYINDDNYEFVFNFFNQTRLKQFDFLEKNITKL
jgi:hypothetical protein